MCIFSINCSFPLTYTWDRSDIEPTPKKQKRERVPKVAPCSKCYVNNRTCDTGSPCEQCIIRSKGSKCERVMCKHFNKGTCKYPNCTFAHEGDGYRYLTPYIKLKPAKPAKHEEKEIGKSEGGGNDEDDEQEGGVKLPV